MWEFRPGMLAGVALIALVMPVAIPAAAQAQQQQLEQMFERCTVGDDKYTADQTISACTAQIEWGRGEPSRRVFALRAYHARALAWEAKGDFDKAIADIDQAMQLAAKPDPGLYATRGGIWRAKGDLDRALADFSEAIRLDPKSTQRHFFRGQVWFEKGDFDRAIADYDQAIAGTPTLFFFYQFRGLAHLYAGAHDTARADFVRAGELMGLDVDVALWLDIVDKRGNRPSGLAAAAKQLEAKKFDLAKWPGPLIRLYLGQGTPEAVLAAADDPDRDTKRYQACQANFFLGELASRQGKKDEAKRLFGLAAAGCETGRVEHWAARAELKALRADR